MRVGSYREDKWTTRVSLCMKGVFVGRLFSASVCSINKLVEVAAVWLKFAKDEIVRFLGLELDCGRSL